MTSSRKLASQPKRRGVPSHGVQGHATPTTCRTTLHDSCSYAAGAEGNLGTLGLLKLPRLLRLGRLLKKLDQLSAATAVRILYIVTGRRHSMAGLLCG